MHPEKLLKVVVLINQNYRTDYKYSDLTIFLFRIDTSEACHRFRFGLIKEKKQIDMYYEFESQIVFSNCVLFEFLFEMCDI